MALKTTLIIITLVPSGFFSELGASDVAASAPEAADGTRKSSGPGGGDDWVGEAPEEEWWKGDEWWRGEEGRRGDGGREGEIEEEMAGAGSVCVSRRFFGGVYSGGCWRSGGGWGSDKPPLLAVLFEEKADG